MTWSAINLAAKTLAKAPKAPNIAPRPHYENQPVTKWKDDSTGHRTEEGVQINDDNEKRDICYKKPYTKTATIAIAISINNNSRKENNQEMRWRHCRLLLLLSLRCEHPYCKIDKDPKHHPSKQSKSMREPPNLLFQKKKLTFSTTVTRTQPTQSQR